MTLDFIVLALAVARLARLVTTDTILESPRNWLLTRWPAEDTIFGDSEVTDGRLSTGVEVVRADIGWFALRPHKWSELLSCYWCASVWLGIVVWVAYLVYPVTVTILAPLALAYIAGFLNDR